MKNHGKNRLPKIIAVVGPTASGKSDLAVKIARKYNGEIISADSRQVYRGLNIGTGKITKHEMLGVPHHLLDVADPKKRFTVADFKTLADKAIADISSRGKLPIICGGTGFYIDTVTSGSILPDVQPNKALRRKLGQKSATELFEILKKLDPKRAKNIDQNNSVRLIRAIEIAQALGAVPPLATDNENKYQTLFIGIKIDKEKLKAKILKRLNSRLEQGMVDEAKKLHVSGLSWRRMHELGLEYRYLAQLLQGKISKSEFIEKLNTEIWHYARRQIQWFKRNQKIHWFALTEKTKINAAINQFVR